MTGVLGLMTSGNLRRLHRAEITDKAKILQLLETLRDAKCVLKNGMDHRNSQRTAVIQSVSPTDVTLSARNIEPSRHPQVYFSFELSDKTFFFVAEPISGGEPHAFRIHHPLAVYEAERRAVPRTSTDDGMPPLTLEIESAQGWRRIVDAIDFSPSGVAISVPFEVLSDFESPVRVRFLNGRRAGESAFGLVRHRSEANGTPAQWRLGLTVTQVPVTTPVPVQRRTLILDPPGAQRAWKRIQLAGAVVRNVQTRLVSQLGIRRERMPEVEIVDFPNEKGQSIRAIVNRVGDEAGSPAVVIPPAWGRTKETLAPLAATLLRTFERRGESLTVVRFDGTQRRGESFIDPSCRRPGDESINFTFSQAVRDVHATLRFLQTDPVFLSSRVILITFSLAAIDGRRAVAADPTGIISGWISVVGMVDVQSGLRSVSGGVDYVYGAQRGVTFGVHELGGVKVHIDRAAEDVLDHRLGAFEEAREDMAKIQVPVTWIHGRHDAWMDLDQVRDLVSAGDSSKRNLIEVPTGHQLRNSREALETFQLVAEEASEMLLSRRLDSAVPDLVKLRMQQKAERSRRPVQTFDVKGFWRDYLVGPNRTLGIELLTATSGYSRFMERQIELLRLQPGDSVADLGCGTGDFSLFLARRQQPQQLSVTSVDYVAEGLRRARERLESCDHSRRPDVQYVLSDLDTKGRLGIPLRAGTFDAALASLLVSYLEDPLSLLVDIYALLRPGGRLVLSAPKRDADLSKLYVDMMAELPPARVRAMFGIDSEKGFEEIQRHYLNEAARLLTLEEAGRFEFRDEFELAQLVERAGFREIKTELALGEPPQSVVVAASRH